MVELLNMSVSDIVAIRRDGALSCHYCDSFGFQQITGFLDANPLKNAEMSMVWFLRGICKQCISRLYVYVIFKLSNPHIFHKLYSLSVPLFP